MSEKRISAWTAVLMVLCCLGLLAADGCGGGSSVLTENELDRIAVTEKIQLVEKAGGLVLVVGGETITSDEIIEAPSPTFEPGETIADLLRPLAQRDDPNEFKERAGPSLREVVVGKISAILLYQHAKRKIGGNMGEGLDKMAEKELRKFVLRYGGDQAKADEALKEQEMDRESFKENHKRFLITQSYLATKLPYRKPVTYGELVEYYEANKDKLFHRASKLHLRLIDINFGKIEITSLDQNRAEKARELAADLAKRIRDGEDFGELAEAHSHGPWQAFGGLWPEMDPSSLADPYAILAEKAEQAEVGQVVGPIEAAGHIFLMKLEEKQAEGYEPLEKVQGEVHNRIVRARRNEAIIRLNDRLLRQAAIGETDEFVDFCLDKIYEISNAPIDAAANTN